MFKQKKSSNSDAKQGKQTFTNVNKTSFELYQPKTDAEIGHELKMRLLYSFPAFKQDQTPGVSPSNEAEADNDSHKIREKIELGDFKDEILPARKSSIFKRPEDLPDAEYVEASENSDSSRLTHFSDI